MKIFRLVGGLLIGIIIAIHFNFDQIENICYVLVE